MNDIEWSSLQEAAELQRGENIRRVSKWELDCRMNGAFGPSGDGYLMASAAKKLGEFEYVRFAAAESVGRINLQNPHGGNRNPRGFPQG